MTAKISRRQMLRMTALAGATTALAACAPQVIEKTVTVKETVEVEKQVEKEVTKVVEVEKQVTAAPAAPEPVAMTFYVGWGGLWGKLNEEIAKMYSDQHPGTTIEVLTGHDWDKLTTAIAGGTPPDVSHGYWAWMRLIATQGGIPSIAERVNLGGPCGKENYDQVWWDMVSRNGEPYAVPYLVGGTYGTMTWNKKLFEKQSLDPEQPPLTIADLLSYGEKLTTLDEAGNIDVLGYNTSNVDLTLWAWAVGTEFYDPARRVFQHNNEKLVDVVQRFADATKQVDREKILAWGQAHQGGTYTPEGTFPSEHEAIMIGAGDWTPGELRQSAPQLEGHYGITWIPNDISKKICCSYLHTILIPKGAKNPDAAWSFIEYAAASDEVANKAFKDVSAMYPWKPWRDTNDWSQMPYAQFFIDTLKDADVIGPSLPPEVFGLLGAEVNTRQSSALETIMLGQATVAEAFAQLDAELQPLLDKAIKQYG